MADAFIVAVPNSLHKLLENRFGHGLSQHLSLPQQPSERQLPSIFHNEQQLPFILDHMEQIHNIMMLQLP